LKQDHVWSKSPLVGGLFSGCDAEISDANLKTCYCKQSDIELAGGAMRATVLTNCGNFCQPAAGNAAFSALVTIWNNMLLA
jgi:hypothetical protein